MVSSPPELKVAGKITKWDDLTSLVAQYAEDTWIFRGVCNIEYHLIPKVGRPEWRHQGFSNNSREYRVAEERELLDDFEKRARPYLTYLPRSKIEWMAIAQHHGLPTRLLDWSESLFVAAYFATESSGTNGDAAIYCAREFRFINEEADIFAIPKPHCYKPPHISPRIPAQRAVFTIHAHPSNYLRGSRIEKWIIDKKCCLQVKRLLDACGINRASLFPDLDGLSTSLGWRYKWHEPRGA